MNKKAMIDQATNLGRKAFGTGLKSTPMKDVQLMDFISSLRPVIGNEIGASSFIFKAWSKGWHTANMAQIVLH